MTEKIFPPPFTKVFFRSATGIVKFWKPGPGFKPISGATSKHGAMPAVFLENGHIYINNAWGRPPRKKIEKLSDEDVKRWKKNRLKNR